MIIIIHLHAVLPSPVVTINLSSSTTTEYPEPSSMPTHRVTTTDPTPTSSVFDDSTDSTAAFVTENTAAIIGVVVIAVILIIALTVVLITVLVLKSRHHGDASIKNAPEK